MKCENCGLNSFIYRNEYRIKDYWDYKTKCYIVCSMCRHMYWYEVPDYIPVNQYNRYLKKKMNILEEKENNDRK